MSNNVVDITSRLRQKMGRSAIDIGYGEHVTALSGAIDAFFRFYLMSPMVPALAGAVEHLIEKRVDRLLFLGLVGTTAEEMDNDFSRRKLTFTSNLASVHSVDTEFACEPTALLDVVIQYSNSFSDDVFEKLELIAHVNAVASFVTRYDKFSDLPSDYLHLLFGAVSGIYLNQSNMNFVGVSAPEVVDDNYWVGVEYTHNDITLTLTFHLAAMYAMENTYRQWADKYLPEDKRK